MQALALIGTDRVQSIIQIKPRLDLYNGQDLAAPGQKVNLALGRLEAKPQDAITLKDQPKRRPILGPATGLPSLGAAL